MAPVNNFHAFLIGGTNSGCGKTTVTLGILRALARRGFAVAPFKCGPDYIDPLFHQVAAGRASVNLEPYFNNLASFDRYAADADMAVVEGVMGLFDGQKVGSMAGSSGEIAARLKLPVVLTVSARGLSGSLAPLVKGFAAWSRQVNIIGVIANQTGSERHGALLKETLAAAGLPPLLGALPRDPELALPERHLGLSTDDLSSVKLDRLADAIEKSVDLDLLLKLAVVPRPAVVVPPLPPVSLRLGVAKDEAFCFYYQETFDLLRQYGVETVFFSPLADRELPPRLDGLYLGGGYPELHAARLSQNQPMLTAIREFAQTHSVYGECGGYMYLLDGVTALDGRFYPLAGLLPGRAVMGQKLSALGFREVDGDWGKLRGHEFHYSSLTQVPEPPFLWRAAASDGREFAAGSVRGRVRGSYIHLHFLSNVEALKSWIGELQS